LHFAFDGWKLATDPEDPIAFRLYGWLRRFSEIAPHHRYTLFYPRGLEVPCPGGVDVMGVESGLAPIDHLRWEQILLPRRVRQAGADVLCFGGPTGALASPIPSVAVIDAAGRSSERGLTARVRAALGTAGAHLADRALHADDLDDQRQEGRAGRPYSPFVDAAFRPKPRNDDREVFRRYELQYGYALCHSPLAPSLPALLAGWSWAAPSVGALSPLVFLGLDSRRETIIEQTVGQFGVGDSVRSIHGVRFGDLPAIYRGAQVLLHPGASQSGMELRWAMAAGTPVAGYQGPAIERLMGSAGYLVPRSEARALGAACLTLLADEHAAESLSEAGLKRAAAYRDPHRVQALLRILEEAANP
jgi:hypothetical protein